MQFVALIVVVVYLIVFGVDEPETTVKKYPEQTIESLGWERSKTTGWVYHKVPGLTPSEQDELKRLLMAIEATDIIYTSGDIKRYTALLVIKMVREEEVYKKYLTIENRH